MACHERPLCLHYHATPPLPPKPIRSIHREHFRGGGKERGAQANHGQRNGEGRPTSNGRRGNAKAAAILKDFNKTLM